MKRVRLAWDFPSDQATLFSTWQGNMVVQNLQTHQPSEVWRSNGLPAVISGQFKTPQPVTFVYLGYHNLSCASTIKIELAQDLEMNGLFEKTYSLCYGIGGFGLEPFGLTPFGSPVEDDSQPPFLVWLPEIPVNYLFFRVTINDPSNPDGNIQAGRLALGKYWSPSMANIMWGYSQKRERVQKGKRGRLGIRRSFRTESYRTVNLSFEYLTAEDYETLDKMEQECGDFKNILVSVYPELGTTEESKHVMLGFIEESSGFSRQNVAFRNYSLTIGEAL